MKKLLVLVASLLAFATISNAQVCALKSNAVYLGIGGINLGAEFSIAPQWTIEASGTAFLFSPWGKASNEIYTNGWDAIVEGRYYLCKAFNGHHFGAFLEGARFGKTEVFLQHFGKGAELYNVQAGVLGVSYGYYFKLNTYWGIDLTAGFGMGAGRFCSGADYTNASDIKFIMVPRLQAAVSYKF